PYSAMLAKIQYGDRPEVQAWLRSGLTVGKIFDQAGQGERLVFISEHEDAVIGTEIGYGNATRPDDYLENFQRFIQENMNSMPALLLVTQRPRDLTRQDLKDLSLQLQAAGYSQTNLQVAWREMTNQEITANIIGFIRQAALGDPLIPYEERVRRAIQKILASQGWSYPQRRWLERIGMQLNAEMLVDQEALNNGLFKIEGGGFKRLDKVFDGKLAAILDQINEAIWQA
ncbi:MAG: type I restriction-modification enzyme R subunit C-terminal domain-containing protein, partial [Microcoleaceae cyanobacterium]